MATITAASAASTVPVYQPPAAALACKVGTVEATAAQVDAANTFELVRIPKGATVVDLMLITDDLEGSTPALTLHVGDGDDPNRYIDATTVGQAGGVARAAAATAFPRTYTAEDTIDVTIGTVAGANPQGGTITLVVLYLGE